MDNKGYVYITYENSRNVHVTGVYSNKKLAEKEQKERQDLSIIDSFEVKGYRGNDFSHINDICKYYNSHLETIRELISCLYNLEGCVCGGIAHVVIDENNIDDDDIDWLLNLCNEEEYKDREEVGLVRLIAEELKKLSIQERTLLFASFYVYRVCDGNCESCPVEKGKINEIIND